LNFEVLNSSLLTDETVVPEYYEYDGSSVLSTGIVIGASLSWNDNISIVNKRTSCILTALSLYSDFFKEIKILYFLILPVSS
jgi:hypothetical protein